MAGATDLARMVPGFDFLQGLLKNAGASLPSMGQWVAPTLDPAELDKRIQELKTVQFWLEQNANLLGTTIQALEVQRMTLSTLQTLNLPLADLTEALKIKLPQATAPAPAPEPAPAPAPAAPAAVDPLQWWGALTQQFTELAAKAVKDTTTDAAKSLASAVAQQSLGSAGGALRTAAASPVKAATAVARTAAPKAARKRASPR
jgi:hypothetical protein